MSSPSDNPAPERRACNHWPGQEECDWCRPSHPQPPADAPSPGAQCGECGEPLDDGHCVKCSGGLKKGWLAKDVAKATERVAEWRGEPGAQEALPLSEARRGISALREPAAVFSRVPNTIRQSLADIIERLLAENKLRRNVIRECEADIARLQAALEATERKLREAEAETDATRSAASLLYGRDPMVVVTSLRAANATLQREKDALKFRAETAEAALVAEPPECDPDCSEAHCPYTHSPVTWKDKAEDYRREIELLRESLEKTDARITDLTSALAGAREEADKLWRALFWIDNTDPELTAAAEAKFDFDMAAHLRALPSPTSEKAEGAEEGKR